MPRPPVVAAALCLLLVTACQRETAKPVSSSAESSPDAVLDNTARTVPGGGAPAPAIDHDAPPPPSVTMPSADAETPMMAQGAMVKYGCDDGNLWVAYGNGMARMTLPDGSHADATLSVDASARSGGEVYVGQRVGLQRLGSAVEVQSGGHVTRRCLETSSDA